MEQLDELVRLLDMQIELLAGRASLMRRSADCITRGDLAGLEALLAADEAHLAQSSELEGHIARLRESLAAACGVQADQLTLGRLVAVLDGPVALALSDRRERLSVLLQDLSQESQTTAMLVRHMLSINRRMLSALTGQGPPNTVYSPDGQLRPDSRTGAIRHCV